MIYTVVGMAYGHALKNDEICVSEALWLIHYFDSLKEDADTVTFLDKLKAILLLKQKTDILNPDNISHLNGFASIWCSVENIFLAATAEGYACTLRVPLGNEGEWVRDVLGYPEDYFMPCFIGIGKAKADADVVKQKDIEVKERIHWDRW